MKSLLYKNIVNTSNTNKKKLDNNESNNESNNQFIKKFKSDLDDDLSDILTYDFSNILPDNFSEILPDISLDDFSNILPDNLSNVDKNFSNYYLGRIFNYEILQNSETGNCIYLIGEEHSITEPEADKKIVSMKEFLLSLQEVYKNFNSLKIITEGIVNNSNILSGNLHTATTELNNAIGIDLRNNLASAFLSINPNVDSNIFFTNTNINIPDNILLDYKKYYDTNGVDLIKTYFPVFNKHMINYYKSELDKHVMYSKSSYIPSYNPIIDVTAICTIRYLTNQTNLVYYAHWGHIEKIKKHIDKLYDKVLYKYDSEQYDTEKYNYRHCDYKSNERICDSKYIMNLTPNAYLPFYDNDYFNALIQDTYNKTKIRKNLNA